MSKLVKHLRIEGHVQGVGFRYSMFYAAQRFGVTGWIRNRRDGSVEMLIQGRLDQVSAVIAAAREGPGMARVEHVHVSDSTGDFSAFSIEPTA